MKRFRRLNASFIWGHYLGCWSDFVWMGLCKFPIDADFSDLMEIKRHCRNDLKSTRWSKRRPEWENRWCYPDKTSGHRRPAQPVPNCQIHKIKNMWTISMTLTDSGQHRLIATPKYADLNLVEIDGAGDSSQIVQWIRRQLPNWLHDEYDVFYDRRKYLFIPKQLNGSNGPNFLKTTIRYLLAAIPIYVDIDHGFGFSSEDETIKPIWML